MDKRFLKRCLADGMSLEKIGEATGRHPSTVSYWLKKHGLRALGADRHSAKQSIDPARIRELAEGGATIREICEELDAGYSSVRYWIVKLGLATERMRRVRQFDEARKQGLKRVQAKCRRHGQTVFVMRTDGAFRCRQCNSEAVAARRRRVKQILVGEAGGACAICGYNDHPSALEFHHLDPTLKAFGVSRRGVTRSIDAVREEARKCILLCANCHAKVEAGAADVPVNDDRYSSSEQSEGGKSFDVAQVDPG
jgi:transposase-like protein